MSVRALENVQQVTEPSVRGAMMTDKPGTVYAACGHHGVSCQTRDVTYQALKAGWPIRMCFGGKPCLSRIPLQS